MAKKKETQEQELIRLRKENTVLKEVGNRALSMKISVKGALSVYGMGRFPVTLYKEQWLKLAKFMQSIVDFIEAHDSELVSKTESLVKKQELAQLEEAEASK